MRLLHKISRTARLFLLIVAIAATVGGLVLISSGVWPTLDTSSSIRQPLASFTPTITETAVHLRSAQVIPSMPTVVIQYPVSHAFFFPVILKRYATLPCNRGEEPSSSHTRGVLSGKTTKWNPLTLSLSGPMSSELDDTPNPFLDYRLQAFFLGPSGQLYNVPGYFAGDGQGNGDGSVWQARFAPDEAGLWRYCVSFRRGYQIAVDSDPFSGKSAAFDGASGEFRVTEIDPHAPGFLRWGRLEYVGAHYLKFLDGPYWLKGGTNSPENFLGYTGFDNTFDQGGIIKGFVHTYAPHIIDWREGDPEFQSVDTGYDSKGIIGALNYLGAHGVNSIYFLPLNLGGDGQDTYPFISPSGDLYGNTHYDISKLYQWNIVLEHAQRQGIAVHMVLNETESTNRRWLDDGLLDIERKLFYREMVARFAYLLALKWNLSEEIVFTHDEIVEFANYIQTLDWASHPLAIHNPAGWFQSYEDFLGDSSLTATSIQYEGRKAGDLVEAWRLASENAGRPWIIDMDENNPAGIGLSPWNMGDLRKEILYDVYFSGGNIEWYAGYHDLPTGGDVNLEDFRTRDKMWDYMLYARQFMQEYLPFWQMRPADELLDGEAEEYGGGEVLAIDGVIYAVYLPVAEPSGILSVTSQGQAYRIRWYDPRIGEFVGDPLTLADENGVLALGPPPENSQGDWVVLVTAVDTPIDLTPPAGYP